MLVQDVAPKTHLFPASHGPQQGRVQCSPGAQLQQAWGATRPALLPPIDALIHPVQGRCAPRPPGQTC